MITIRKPFKMLPTAEYKEVLKEFKDTFQEKWEQKKTSSDVNLDEFDKLAVLGSGAFGTVRLVRYKPENSYFAIKILIKSIIVRQKQVRQALNEKHILQAIEFPFVVNLEFSFKDNDCLYYGMPFVNGGEMFSRLRKYRKFSESDSKFYAAQVFLALEYLHYLNLIYRDLKPENILFDQKGYLKITDFGFCKRVEGRTWTLCGTPEYIAPEIIQSRGYGKSVDWWSFGILIYEMVAGISPFYVPSNDPMALYGRIISGKYNTPEFFSRELENLLSNLLQTDVTRRYGNLRNGSDDIKNHDWFRKIKWHALLNKELDAPYVPRIRNPGDVSNFDKSPEFKIVRSKKCLYEKEFEDF